MTNPSATQLALPERTYEGRVSKEELRDRCEDKLKPIRSLAESLRSPSGRFLLDTLGFPIASWG